MRNVLMVAVALVCAVWSSVTAAEESGKQVVAVADVVVEPLKSPPPPPRIVPEAPADVRRSAGRVLARVGSVRQFRLMTAPDRRRAAALYFIDSPDYLYRLLLVDAAGGTERPVRDAAVGEVAWRPDSRGLAVITVNAAHAVVYYDVRQKKLRTLHAFPDTIPYWLRWRPRGDGMALLVTDQKHIGDRMHGNLYLLDMSGSIRQLTQGFSWVSPAWSPSGARLAVGNESLSSDGDPSVAIFDADGDLWRRIGLMEQVKRAGREAQITSLWWTSNRALIVGIGTFDGREVQDRAWYRITLPVVAMPSK